MQFETCMALWHPIDVATMSVNYFLRAKIEAVASTILSENMVGPGATARKLDSPVGIVRLMWTNATHGMDCQRNLRAGVTNNV